MANDNPASRWLKTTEWLAGKLGDVVAVLHSGLSDRERDEC